MNAVRFGLVELDLLAANAGAVIPYPLRVPSFGRIPGERDVLFAAAGETLRQRGLADQNGPTGLAKAVVAALATRSGTVDLVITGPDGPVGVVAIVYGDRALLCRQVLDGAVDALVKVRSIPLDGLAHALAEIVPDVPAAKAMPLRLPLAAVRAAQRTLTEDVQVDSQLHQIAIEHGCSAEYLTMLVRLGSAATGRGQLGATRPSRDSTDVRAGTELSWLDTTAGRLRVTTQADDNEGWMSINPLRPHELRAAITDLVRARGTAAVGSR